MAKKMLTNIKSYSELITIPTFEDRYRYLKLNGQVGEVTFGFQRWVNQQLYRSREWLKFRDEIILRDNGCDLGLDGFDIHEHIIVHHINPITHQDIITQSPCIFDPENVICTRLLTHNAIHYGDENLLDLMPIERKANDTCPWK